MLVWRLERGERVGVLDTLAASTSLTSTIASLFRLRVLNAIGIVLIAIWALSPVGGQASFRQFSIGSSTDTTSALYEYPATTGNLHQYDNSDRAAIWAAVNILYRAAVIGPAETKRSPLDLWGNVKIPRVEYYEDNHEAESDNDGWYQTHINDNSDPAIFASLIGIPLSGVNGSGFIDYKLNLQTMYLNLSCTKNYIYNQGVPDNAFSLGSPQDSTAHLWWDRSFSVSNMTTARSNISLVNGSMPAYTFGYVNIGIDSSFVVACTLRTTYVEAEVSCADASSCLVSRMRRSRLDHPHANITQLDIATGLYWNWYLFALAFIGSLTTRPAWPTLMDFYIAAPDNPALTTLTNDMAQPADIYAVRLGQLFNAYWSCASMPYTISVGLADGRTQADPNISFAFDDFHNNASLEAQSPKMKLWQTEGTRSHSFEVFRAHKAWVVTLCVASAVLIIASLIPPIIRHFLIKGPDIIMNISSLAMRDNVYIRLPSSGTYLEASDRARLLRDCKVRFGDVDDQGDIGRLAIGEVHDDDAEAIGRVRKTKVYE